MTPAKFHVKLFVVLFFCPLFSWSQMSSIWLKDTKLKEPSKTDSTILFWNTHQDGFSSIGAEATDWLYWINYSRKNPKAFWDSIVQPTIQFYPELDGSYASSLKQELYKTKPLPLFSLNQALTATARAHAIDIAQSEKAPSHNSSDGTGFSSRLQQAGIRFCAAENICTGNHTILLSLVLLYLDINQPQLGHRKNLLSSQYYEIGIGVAKMRDGALFSVQDFSCPQRK
jgi:hypothetical protein